LNFHLAVALDHVMFVVRRDSFISSGGDVRD
jgi:hypothetical protein